MVDERFIEYFKKWESKGHSEEQIKEFLLKKGYPADVINEAASIVAKSRVAAKPIDTIPAPKEPVSLPVQSASVSSSPIRPPNDPSGKKLWFPQPGAPYIHA